MYLSGFSFYFISIYRHICTIIHIELFQLFFLNVNIYITNTWIFELRYFILIWFSDIFHKFPRLSRISTLFLILLVVFPTVFLDGCAFSRHAPDQSARISSGYEPEQTDSVSSESTDNDNQRADSSSANAFDEFLLAAFSARGCPEYHKPSFFPLLPGILRNHRSSNFTWQYFQSGIKGKPCSPGKHDCRPKTF